MVSFRIDYTKEWQGGGHSSVFGISEDGLESFLLKKYVGYDEFSHAIAVEWKLKAEIRVDKNDVYVIDIFSYNITSGSADIDIKNRKPDYSFETTDNGRTWSLKSK